MLFKVVKARGSDGGWLGFEFIEVLCSEPFALTPACTDEDYKEGRDGVSASWAKFGVAVRYICRTEHGLSTLVHDDLWPCIDAGFYCEDTPEGHNQARKTREVMADPPWSKEDKKDEDQTPIVVFDVEEATYIGNEEDGCYYQCGEGDDGWYVTVVVDSNTANFVDSLVTDAGPFDTEEEAAKHGEAAAVNWCLDNGVTEAFPDGYPPESKN